MSKYIAGGFSDVGRVRPVNQDRFLVGNNVFAVADGMGGHVGGEVAAETAVEVLKEVFEKNPTTNGLSNGVREANLAVWNKGLDDLSLRGMGTTLTAAAIVTDKNDEPSLIVAHVGDSRAYLLRGNKLVRLTDDHTLIEELLKRGKITSAQALYDKRRHTLTRALGIEPEVTIDLKQVKLMPGDRIIICSDGLTNEVSEKEIASELSKGVEPTEIAKKLISLARANGGHDNITAVVIILDPEKEQVSNNTAKNMAADKAAIAQKRSKKLLYEKDLEKPSYSSVSQPPPLTFKTLVFFIVIGVITLIGMFVTRLYATDSYFVGDDSGYVAIYQGIPGGVFWFTPKVVSKTKIQTATLTPSEASAIKRGVIESSFSQANSLVAALKKQQPYVVASTIGNS